MDTKYKDKRKIGLFDKQFTVQQRSDIEISLDAINIIYIDRMSFKTFLGLESDDEVPDEKNIWLFREKLTIVKDLFDESYSCV